MENGSIRYFPVWTAMKVSESDISEILDQRLNYANFQVLDKACKVVCRSIQDNESQWRTLQQLVQILQGIQDVSNMRNFHNN